VPKKAKAKPEPVAAAQLRAVEIELLPGEEDSANLAYIEKLANAWACVQEHDLFGTSRVPSLLASRPMLMSPARSRRLTLSPTALR
jgi:hypothetical protein